MQWHRINTVIPKERKGGRAKKSSPRASPNPTRETPHLHLHCQHPELTIESLTVRWPLGDPPCSFTTDSSGGLSFQPASFRACGFPGWMFHAPGISNIMGSSLQFRLHILLPTVVSQGLSVGNLTLSTLPATSGIVKAGCKSPWSSYFAFWTPANQHHVDDPGKFCRQLKV